MRYHGQPGRCDIVRRVQIPVVEAAARRAAPFPDIQRQGRDDMPASGAHLRRRKPAIHTDRAFAIPLSLFFEHPNSHANTGVAQAAGKAVVFDHATQIQILDTNHIKLSHKSRRKLFQSILPAVTDFLMLAGNRMLGERPTLGTLLLLRQPSLQERQAARAALQMLRIGYAFAGRKRGETRNAKVNSDALTSLSERVDIDIHGQADEIAAARVADDGHSGRGASHAARPFHLHVAQFSDGQSARSDIETETGAGKLGGLPPVLAFKARIGRALGEEIGERGLKVAKRLLRRDARHIVEPDRFRLALEHRQRGAGLRIVHPLAALKRFGSLGQRPIVDIARAAKRLSQDFLLPRRRIAAECPALFHSLRIASAVCNVNASTERKGGASSPT